MARIEKKFPSRDIAKAILAPLIAIPFIDVVSEMTMAPETTAAATAPSTEFLTASDIGEEEVATKAGGSAYCTAAFTNI